MGYWIFTNKTHTRMHTHTHTQSHHIYTVYGLYIHVNYILFSDMLDNFLLKLLDLG